jgi:tubulin polyglutamylase TTLL1
MTKCQNGKKKHSLIIQSYITRPLLYNNRKFDIRVYMLIVHHNSKLKAYWYQEGYVRTSSHQYSLDEISDNYIHLTNDAVQKNSEEYGKYEDGNKLSFVDLQRYLDSLSPMGKQTDFQKNIYPQMKVSMLLFRK